MVNSTDSTGDILALAALSLSFGGVRAVSEVSFGVREGRHLRRHRP